MKKTVMALATLVALASCNGSSSESQPVDSLAVDSTVVADSVAVADSSVGVIQGGGSPVEEVFQAKDGELGNPTKREVIK
jgi:hypothetical protein